jgi:hypothetical protein
MKFPKYPLHPGCRAMTIVEVMVAVGIGSVILAAVSLLWVFGARSFVALGNYSDLDARSRFALDRMSREIRQATQVLSYQNTGTTRWLQITNSNQATITRYVWDATDRTLTCERTGKDPEVFLTECDQWLFSFYQRMPRKDQTNTFFVATNSAGVIDPSICKLIDMTWVCSRTILGKKANTESVQTAQIVLRNKQ